MNRKKSKLFVVVAINLIIASLVSSFAFAADFKQGNIWNTFKKKDAEPSHCWVLTDTTHEVMDGESDVYKTWKYEYKDIDEGGQYIIDYTWHKTDEYAHYTAIGECTNIPTYLYPEEFATVDMKVYAENVVADPSVWGLLEMGYIDYHFNEGHWPTNYTNSWDNVKEGEAKYYNCSDGSYEWKLKAQFPEGQKGEKLEVTCKFHRGDRYPVTTTWYYTWKD